MNSDFELLCFQVLDASRNHLMSDDNGMRAPFGWRYRSTYVDMAGEKVCAYLLQRGFVSSQNQFGATCYRINTQGQTEWARLRNPEDFTQGLRAEITMLERQLTAKRAALAALDERAAMTEAGEEYIKHLSETPSADRDRATFGTFPDTEFPDESTDDYLI